MWCTPSCSGRLTLQVSPLGCHFREGVPTQLTESVDFCCVLQATLPTGLKPRLQLHVKSNQLQHASHFCCIGRSMIQECMLHNSLNVSAEVKHWTKSSNAAGQGLNSASQISLIVNTDWSGMSRSALLSQSFSRATLTKRTKS